jgi:D-alanyl-D-alanine carboxypeptidase (penicillin-binding protein 5/6)
MESFVSKKVYLFFCLFVLPCLVFGQLFNTSPLLAPYTDNPPEIGAQAAVLADVETGTLLFSKNADEEIPPASLSKLMTMHLVMKEIEAGRASYDEIIPVTNESWARNQPPRSSVMNLEPRHIVTLREIMLGMAIPSGNDAAVAAALRVAPSMDEFAFLMTQEAKNMGLNVTRFVESSGISEYNMTTAAEFTYFCMQYVRTHPYALHDFHSVQEFPYPTAENLPGSMRQATINWINRNNLIRTFPGVDGLKTGYIDESGYNLALTAERDGTRFVSVILGAESVRNRDADGYRLLSWAFENFKTVRPVLPVIESVKLWKGREDSVQLKVTGSPDFTSPADRANTLKYDAWIYDTLIAPLASGETVGYYTISDEYGELLRLPLVTVREYEKGNIFKRIWHSILLWLKKDK